MKKIKDSFKGKKEWKPLLLIILVILGITLPFINKPIHIDDIYIIEFARHIIVEPFDVYGFKTDFISGKENALTYTDPPLILYFAAGIIKVFGEKEQFLHLCYILFAIIAGISMYYLCRRFSVKPFFATALMISTPTFIVSSHSLMQDLPLLAFFLFSLVIFIKGVDNQNGKLLILGSILAGLTFLIKYNAVILIFLLILYPILKGNYKSLKYLFFTFAIMGLFFLHNYFYYGAIHLFNSLLPWLIGGKGVSSGLLTCMKTLMILFIANLSYIGGATIFFPFFIAPFLKKRKNNAVLIFGVLTSVFLSIMLFFYSKTFVSGQYNLLQLALFSAFISSSIFIIFLIIKFNFSIILQCTKGIFNWNLKKIYKHKKKRDMIFILIWFFTVFIFNSYIAGGSARYNTILLPPLIILFIQILGDYTIKVRLDRILKYAILFTLIVGVSVAYADYQYAITYRKFSNSLNFSGDGKIFFTGHEGFKYYMEQKGGIFLTSYKGEVHKGDIIIVPSLPSPTMIENKIKDKMVHVKTIKYETKFPLRVLNSEAHAGWYKFGAGFLPYSLSNAPLESFNVYIVK